MKLNIVREFKILEPPRTKREFWRDLTAGDVIKISYNNYIGVELNKTKYFDYHNLLTFNNVVETLEKNGLVYEEILRKEKK